MFDIGWSEMAIIMLLALIIIGPKDLPRVARTIGQWVRKGRAMAREFQTSLEEMARDTELDDVRKEIEKVGRTDFKKTIEKTIDPKGDLAKAFETSDDTDQAKPKPVLTDKPALTDGSGETGKETPALPATNGHAAGVTTSSTTEAAKTPSSGKAASTSKTAAKTTKTAGTAKKPSTRSTTKKTAAAKKPVSSPKRSAKPAASASKPETKPAAAKNGADPSPVDERGSDDQAAVAAKSS